MVLYQRPMTQTLATPLWPGACFRRPGHPRTTDEAQMAGTHIARAAVTGLPSRYQRRLGLVVALSGRGVFGPGGHLLCDSGSLLVQEVGDRAAQAGMGDPVGGVSGFRQVAALYLVAAL